MFSTPLRTALIALAAAASAVDAAPALSLKLACPQDAVNGVENLQVVANLTNTGDETLKLFKEPLSVLDDFSGDKFKVMNAAGLRSGFIGAAAKYSPPLAAANPSHIAVIAPGQSVAVTHDLSSAYNFTDTGYGTYTVEATNYFYVLNPNNEVSMILANNEPCTVALASGPLVAAAPDTSTPPAPFTNCTAEQQSALTAAATAAQSLAQDALTYLRANPTSTPRYTTWFGAYTDERHAAVTDNFEAVGASNFTGFSYDCTCTYDAAYAYVYPARFGTVYLCGAFWGAPATGANSQAGTLVFEAAHFTVNGGSTKDQVYGQNGTMSLAQDNPDRAVLSAAAHEYFAENSPALS